MSDLMMRRRRRVVALAGIPLVALAFAGSILHANADSIGFGPAVQLGGNCGGEPSIDVDGQGRVYVSAPKGILSVAASCEGIGNSSGGAATWASSGPNGGTSFGPKVSAGTANGGGDTDTLVDRNNGDVYVADLEAVGSDICVSHDHGATYVSYLVATESCSAGTSALPHSGLSGTTQSGVEADREWLTTYGPTATYPHKDIYLTYHDFAAGEPIQWRSQDGAAFAPQQAPGFSTDPAFTSAVANGTVMAKPVIDAAGNMYALVTTQGTGNGPLIHLWLIKSTDHGSTWTDTSIFAGASTAQLGLVFNDLAIDGAGNLYALALGNSQQAVPPVHAYLFNSIDQGAHWSAPVDLNASPTGDGNALTLAAMHGGPNSGDLVIGWYHSTSSTDPGVIAGNFWNYVALESTNATTAAPSFSTAVLGITNPSGFVHQGQVCVQGLNCTTGQVTGGGQGNRNLADFSSVTVDQNGCAIFTYADDGAIVPDQTNFAFTRVNNNVTRQTSGCFTTLVAGLPEVPFTAAFAAAGTLVVGAMLLRRQRRSARTVQID